MTQLEKRQPTYRQPTCPTIWSLYLFTTSDEMKIFIGTNYFMTITSLPSVLMNWDCNGFVGNSSVQNASIRTCFQALLQNCHFAGNSTVDKSSKIYKI